MDAYGVALGATLLQTRNNTSCAKGEAPDEIILRPIAFTSKSQTGAEKRYSNIERDTLGIPLQFHKRGEYNYRSQTTSHNI